MTTPDDRRDGSVHGSRRDPGYWGSWRAAVVFAGLLGAIVVLPPVLLVSRLAYGDWWHLFEVLDAPTATQAEMLDT